jgi:flagellar export protein FliJ
MKTLLRQIESLIKRQDWEVQSKRDDSLRAKMLVDTAQAEFDTSLSSIRSLEEHIREEGHSGSSLSVNTLLLQKMYLDQQHSDFTRVSEKKRSALAQHEEKVQALENEQFKLKSLERLRDRKLKLHKNHQDRQMSKQMDDLWLQQNRNSK